MSLRGRLIVQAIVLLVIFLTLVMLFPPVLRFVEMAARELRYFWWVILLVALGGWLVWGVGKKKAG